MKKRYALLIGVAFILVLLGAVTRLSSAKSIGNPVSVSTIPRPPEAGSNDLSQYIRITNRGESAILINALEIEIVSPPGNPKLVRVPRVLMVEGTSHLDVPIDPPPAGQPWKCRFEYFTEYKGLTLLRSQVYFVLQKHTWPPKGRTYGPFDYSTVSAEFPPP